MTAAIGREQFPALIAEPAIVHLATAAGLAGEAADCPDAGLPLETAFAAGNPAHAARDPGGSEAPGGPPPDRRQFQPVAWAHWSPHPARLPEEAATRPTGCRTGMTGSEARMVSLTPGRGADFRATPGPGRGTRMLRVAVMLAGSRARRNRAHRGTAR
jgi:hypothetical protein